MKDYFLQTHESNISPMLRCFTLEIYGDVLG